MATNGVLLQGAATEKFCNEKRPKTVFPAKKCFSSTSESVQKLNTVVQLSRQSSSSSFAEKMDDRVSVTRLTPSSSLKTTAG